MTRVLIHPASYDTAQEAVERAFLLFPQEIEGKRVLIKPNVLRASKASEGIVTHPALLKAVVGKVASMKPASLVVGDNPGLFSYGANEESFRSTGLMAAAGGYYRNIGTEAVTVPFNPEFMDTVSISRDVAQADIIISLPKFKTHGLTVVTGAIKNSYGFLPGAQKAVLHRIAGSPPRFNDLIVDVFALRVPDLFIMDAVVGMEGNGPASPDLRQVGQILAADNAVALDTVVAMMMGCDPARLRFLQRAEAAGLGNPDPAAIEVIGELAVLPGFKLPPLGGEAIQGNPAIQELMETRSGMRPRPDPDLCTACGQCVEQCPVSALTLIGALPTVDADTCITCFCCQEMCPEKAMTLR
jgi:uncharacterized protein (DUF362 family)/NAD-dependent dihydropyrimidine dehydrogenase PreA subunit